MELPCHLLPDRTHLQIKNWLIDEAKASIRLVVDSTQAIVKCPVCSFPTHQIHSRYERSLADLLWAMNRQPRREPKYDRGIGLE